MRTLALLIAGFAVPAVAAPKRVTCDTTDRFVPSRNVTIEFEQPEGTKFNAKACGFEFNAPNAIAMVNVIHQDDAGAEQLLNDKDDGPQKWVLRLSDGTIKPVATVKQKLVGEADAVVYRLAGEFHGAKDAEVLVARVKVGKHNVVFMSQYPASESAKIRPAVLQFFSSTAVKISAE